jgi:hypothetical protein
MANLGSYLGSIRSNAYDPGSNFWANRGRGVSAPTSASTAREHEGVDYGTRGATGIGVSAAMGGILKIVDASTGFGMRVEVTTTMPDGTKIVVNYGHVKASSGLIDSQVVFAGQIIGTVEGKDVLTASGGTVGSGFTGPHLHLEIRKNGALQDPYQFDQWQGAQHFVGTDSVGNLKIAQTLTSAFDGSSFTTITTKSPAGVVLGSSQTSTLDLQDGGGNSIGTRTVYNTYGSYGSSQVVTVSGLNGNLVQRTTTQTNGDVFQERAGLRFQTINGVTSASVDGLAVPMTTQPDGSYNLATSSGNLNVKLNADPFAGGVITAAGHVINTDGIVVNDLNGNRQNNAIRETSATFYNGNAGIGQTVWRKIFGSGFTAQKSMDANAENQFRQGLRISLRKTGCSFLISCAAGAAFGLPPVRMTEDEYSTLDLTKAAGRVIDILDCQMRVEGSPPTYELVHAKGRLPIPQLAVKQIQDDGLVDIKVNARLGKLPVTRLWLHYSKQKNEVFKSTWSGFTLDGQVIHGNAFSLLIDAPLEQVVSTLRRRNRGMTVRYPNPSDPRTTHRVVSVLSGVGDFDTTGYGIESWGKLWPRATTIDYMCSLSKAR